MQSYLHPAIMAGKIMGMSLDPVAVLQRWEQSGAHWRVLHRGAGSVTVALVTCDGGEEVDRLTSGDAALLEFLRERDSDLD